MAHARSTMPVRRERRSDLLADILRLSSTGNRTVSRKKARDALLTLKNLTDLVNEYCGASNAAFVAMEQVEDFSSHARTAKANRDWRDEQDLWDAASRLMLSSIKHRDYELKCRKEEYRLYKEYMSDLEKKVQKSIMAYCKRRLHRLRTWEIDNLRLKASIVHLDKKIHFAGRQYQQLQEEKEHMLQDVRINGSRRAHVTAFGDGWEGRNGGRAQVHNDAFELRQMNYQVSRTRNWIEKSMNEREDAIRLWARNKIASDAFQDQWSRTDQEARRLLSIYEAQRDGRPIPGFERPQPSPLISSLGEEDATDWEEDFDVPISRHGSVLPHNLLSPTPTSEAGIGETAFKYASMNLNDKRQSGVDSGYDSGKTSGSVSTALAPGVSDEKPTIRWDEPHERVNSEATWQAAWDAVIPEPSSTESDRANLTVNEWEYTYAQE